MFCRACNQELNSDGHCPACAAQRAARPTIIGRGAGSYCPACGTRNASGAASCCLCGAALNGPSHLWLAGLLTALLALLSMALLWRALQPQSAIQPQATRPVVQEIPATSTTIIIRNSEFSPGQDHWQMTEVTQAPGWTVVSSTETTARVATSINQ